jgi:hypothetical protein
MMAAEQHPPEGREPAELQRREAKRARSMAAERLREAQAAEARALTVLDELGIAVQQLSGVEGEIDNLHAGRIRDGDATAEALEVPPDLAGQVRRKEELTRQVADAKRALAMLTADTGRAKESLAHAKAVVTAAAEALLVAESIRIAAELVAAEEIARDLRVSLTGLSRVWFAERNRQRPLVLPPSVQKLLNEPALNDLACHQGYTRRPLVNETENWRTTAAKLVNDDDERLH